MQSITEQIALTVLQSLYPDFFQFHEGRVRGYALLPVKILDEESRPFEDCQSVNLDNQAPVLLFLRCSDTLMADQQHMESQHVQLPREVKDLGEGVTLSIYSY